MLARIRHLPGVSATDYTGTRLLVIAWKYPRMRTTPVRDGNAASFVAGIFRASGCSCATDAAEHIVTSNNKRICFSIAPDRAVSLSLALLGHGHICPQGLADRLVPGEWSATRRFRT